jgi:prefoldin subunit 5
MHQDVNQTDVSILSARLQTLHTDVSDIKGTLKDLTSAINKLALVEERITNAAAAQERTFKAIEKLEERIDSLEKAQVIDDNTARWIDRGVVAFVGAAAAYIWERIRNGQ